MTPLQLMIALAVAGGFALVLAIAYWVQARQRQQKDALLLQRFEELETLSRVSRSIGKTTLDPVALASLIAHEAAQIIDTRNFQVGLFRGDLLDIIYASQNGTPLDKPTLIRLESNDGAIARLRGRMETHYVPDLAQLNQSIETQSLVGDPPQSALLIPLLGGEAAIGVIAAFSRLKERYDISQINRLEVVANQAASALSNAALYEEERNLSSDLELVSSIARQVNTLENSDAIFKQVGDFAHKQLNLHLVMIFAIDPSSNMSEMKYSSHPDFAPGTKFPWATDGMGLIGASIATRQTVLANDVTQDARYVPGIGLDGYEDIAERTTAEVVIPLVAKNQLLGIMDFQSDHADGFTKREVRVLEALAQEIAGSLDRALEVAAQREQAWITRAQLEIARTFTEQIDTDALIESVVSLPLMLLGATQCALLVEDDEGVFRPKAIQTPMPAQQEQFCTLAITRGDWGTFDAALVGKTMRQATLENAWFSSARGQAPELHPLIAGGDVHGMLLIEPCDTSSFTSRQNRLRGNLLDTLLRQLARRIERTKLRTAQQAESWNNVALLQVAQAMNSLTNLNKILNLVVRLVSMLIGVKFSFLLVTDNQADALVAGPSFGLSETAQTLLSRLDENELDEQLRVNEMPINSESGIELFDVELPDRLAETIGAETVQVIPLRARNSMVGILAIGPTRDGQALSGRRFALLAGIAQQAAIAVVNDQLYAESAETEQLQKELDVALSIQSSLIPDGSPDIPGLTVASYWEAARQVSGDFYDFLRLHDGNWGIVIADVAGKGVPAALFMALSRTIIRSVGFTRNNPIDTLIRCNEIILNDTHSELFITVFFAIWDQASGILHFANGGHNRPLILRADGSVGEVGDYGIALGVIENVPLVAQQIALDIGDMVVMYTDGITEAMNGNFETLGLAKLMALLDEARPDTPQAAIGAMRQAVMNHASDVAQSDDMTIVAIKRTA